MKLVLLFAIFCVGVVYSTEKDASQRNIALLRTRKEAVRQVRGVQRVELAETSNSAAKLDLNIERSRAGVRRRLKITYDDDVKFPPGSEVPFEDDDEDDDKYEDDDLTSDDTDDADDEDFTADKGGSSGGEELRRRMLDSPEAIDQQGYNKPGIRMEKSFFHSGIFLISVMLFAIALGLRYCALARSQRRADGRRDRFGSMPMGHSYSKKGGDAGFPNTQPYQSIENTN